VSKNSDASSKNLKSELKNKITTPSRRRRKISESVEKVRRDLRPTLSWFHLIPRLHDTAGCQSGCTTRLTTHWLYNRLNNRFNNRQYRRYSRLSNRCDNRFDNWFVNRLYCVNGAWRLLYWRNKSSAVAEMGDRGHIDMGRKDCGLLGPRLIQCGPGRGLLPYQVASSSIRPFGHNRHGPKIG